jgi:oligoendopeptidase F
MTEAKIEFGTFEVEEKVNPYLETIDKMIEAGENASITLTVDVVNEGKEKLLIAKAANAKDKTARLRVRDDSKVKYGNDENGEQVPTGGSVKLTYTLTKRHQPRRRKAAEAEPQAAQA